jgi:hypothetical protein
MPFVDAGRADLGRGQMLWEIPLTVALHFLGVPKEDMDTAERVFGRAHRQHLGQAVAGTAS